MFPRLLIMTNKQPQRIVCEQELGDVKVCIKAAMQCMSDYVGACGIDEISG